ncbi:helix-turn-helix domain-containing protein [Xenorhabdus szentirmaii]|uniref:helix-turn-helix domain-containing protein n=1 Tax=Xenorhabdus szentirmaii TaxID=290112 RepID=UPI0019B8AAD7|nr:helix-turn-helix domain-containing protein [Xenorhabdus sp. 38]
MKEIWYELVKARMKEIGVSQEKLAESLGVTQGAVGHWLNGRRVPSVGVIMEIMKAVGFNNISFDSEGMVNHAEKENLSLSAYHAVNTLKNRLKTILVNEGMKQKQLAEALNVSAQTVNNWLSRDAISREAAQSISEQFGYSLDWLLNGVGDQKLVNLVKYNYAKSNVPPEQEWAGVSSWDSQTPLDDNEVEVPFLKDIEFACGNGSVTDVDYNGYKLRFSKATLRRIGAPTDGSTIVCFPAKGNSMEPVIPDGAAVAIDIANKHIIDGKIYAIEQDDLKRIKCLYRKPGGKLLIRSYNRDEYEDEIADESNVKIIGKLFWHSVLHY